MLHLREMRCEYARGFRDVFLGGGPLIQCLAKSLGEGVGKMHGFHGISVVVDDLNLVGVGVFPDENDPPLLLDPNAVKIAQVAGQLLKAVTGCYAQVVQFGCDMELIKFHLARVCNSTGSLRDGVRLKTFPVSASAKRLTRRKITKNESQRKRKL